MSRRNTDYSPWLWSLLWIAAACLLYLAWILSAVELAQALNNPQAIGEFLGEIEAAKEAAKEAVKQAAEAAK